MLLKWSSRLLNTIVFLVFLYISSHLFAPLIAQASPISNVFINEIHYDNDGIDIFEYIEVSGDSSIDLTDWSLRLYNGKDGKEGKLFSLGNWSYTDPITNFSFLTVDVKGIQNGSPDGIALFEGINLVQFLSYEGSFTATTGDAIGIASEDIGVLELSNTPVGFSLQLTGQGQKYSDFTWASPQQSTFDGINIGQKFVNSNTDIISVNEPSTLLLFSVFLIFFIKRFLIYTPVPYV